MILLARNYLLEVQSKTKSCAEEASRKLAAVMQRERERPLICTVWRWNAESKQRREMSVVKYSSWYKYRWSLKSKTYGCGQESDLLNKKSSIWKIAFLRVKIARQTRGKIDCQAERDECFAVSKYVKIVLFSPPLPSLCCFDSFLKFRIGFSAQK